jgi:hypothetical protein
VDSNLANPETPNINPNKTNKSQPQLDPPLAKQQPPQQQQQKYNTYATTCDTISPQAEIQNFKQCKKIQPRLQNLLLSQEICRSRDEKINKNDEWMGYPTYLLLRLKASLPAKSTGR